MLDSIVVKGGAKLVGEIAISGSKNSTLPIMASSILLDGTLVLSNVPELEDVATMSKLLLQHGVDIIMDGTKQDQSNYGRTILLNGSKIHNLEAPYDIVRKMRASILVMGPCLARFGKARVSLPGGCAIGTRPIDLHLCGLEALGAKYELKDGYVDIEAPSGGLVGAEITFPKISVGATENILMAATLANGVTHIHNAAREPEIVDLANCLRSMGAKIDGAGTDTIKIEGVPKLSGCHHKVIADRIEAGTYAIAASITNGRVLLKNIDYQLVANIMDKLSLTGTKIVQNGEGILIDNTAGMIKPLDLTTEAFPGFPTDMQAQFMTLLCVGDGVSTISEHIFENRFMHVPELLRMGADITIKGDTAIIRGVKSLKSAPVMASDLRASVSLVIAGLRAEGDTVVNRVYHLDRGYEHLEEKLAKVGATIYRKSSEIAE